MVWFQVSGGQGTKKALIDLCNFLSLAKSSLIKSTERQISWARMTGSFFTNLQIEFLAVLTTIIVVVTYVRLNRSACRKNVMWTRWIWGMLFRPFSSVQTRPRLDYKPQTPNLLCRVHPRLYVVYFSLAIHGKKQNVK